LNLLAEGHLLKPESPEQLRCGVAGYLSLIKIVVITPERALKLQGQGQHVHILWIPPGNLPFRLSPLILIRFSGIEAQGQERQNQSQPIRLYVQLARQLGDERPHLVQRVLGDGEF
jgi:hypothetical protein